MYKQINDFIKKLQDQVKPWIKKIQPYYKKVKPYQDQAVEWFFAKTRRFLVVNEAQKKNIISGRTVLYSRLAVLGAVIFQLFIAGILVGSLQVILSSLVFYLPLVFLVFRGYRIAPLLLIVMRTFDSLFIIFANPLRFINVVLWWIVICAVYFNGFRIENARIQMQKNGELPRKRSAVLRDSIIAVLLFVAALMAAGISSSFTRHSDPLEQEQADVELGMVSTFIVHNQYGYSDFCADNGYVMQNYPQAFATQFSSEIERVEKKLAARGMSLQKVYEQLQQTHGEKLQMVVKSSLDAIRRQAIVEKAAQEENIPVAEVKYTPELDKKISFADACQMFDNAAAEILAQPNPQYALIRQYN